MIAEQYHPLANDMLAECCHPLANVLLTTGWNFFKVIIYVVRIWFLFDKMLSVLTSMMKKKKLWKAKTQSHVVTRGERKIAACATQVYCFKVCCT